MDQPVWNNAWSYIDGDLLGSTLWRPLDGDLLGTTLRDVLDGNVLCQYYSGTF